MALLESYPTVIISHQPDSALVQAQFVWPEGKPQDTYSLDVTPHASIEFDSHFPIRPDLLSLYEDEATDQRLEELFGKNLMAAIAQARRDDIVIARLALTTDQRLEIAHTQLTNEATPTLLRQASHALIEASEVNLPLLAA